MPFKSNGSTPMPPGTRDTASDALRELSYYSTHESNARKRGDQPATGYWKAHAEDSASQWGPELGKMPPNKDKHTPLGNGFRSHDEDKD